MSKSVEKRLKAQGVSQEPANPEERARKWRYEAERLAECLIAVLASVYSQKKSFAHPGDDISAKVTEIILERDAQVQAEAREAGFKNGTEWKRISGDAIRNAALEEAVQVVKDWNFMACSDADGLVYELRSKMRLAKAAAPTKEEE